MIFSEQARKTGLFDLVEPAYSSWQTRRWRQKGSPPPAPAAVKRQTLVSYAKRYSLDTLIETGTYKGDTVRALRHDFKRIYSIELWPELHASAAKRCAGQANAEILLGDSATVLPSILNKISGPALFWLDAHYNGPNTALGEVVSPIEAELEAVLTHSVAGHVILIDDVRQFQAHSTTGYPPPTAVLDTAARHGYDVSDEGDVYRLVPGTRVS